MNQDYVTEYKAQTVDGVQTVTFKINPKAAFNDGTPIDVNAVKSYQTIYTAAASGSDYQITPRPSGSRSQASRQWTAIPAT